MTIKNINMENNYAIRMVEWDYLFKISVMADKQESIEFFAENCLYKSLNEYWDLTNGLEFVIKDISFNEQKIARLLLWLYSNNQRFKSIRRMYVRGSSGIILIFDSTDNKSLDIVSEQIALVRNVISDVPIILVGIKLDLEPNQEISKKQLDEFKENHHTSDSILLVSEEDVKKMLLSLIKMIKIDEVDEKFFSLEPRKAPPSKHVIRRQGEEPLRVVNSELQEAYKTYIDLFYSPFRLSRRSWISLLIFAIILYTSVIVYYIFFYVPK